MPVQINEVVIRTVVDNSPPPVQSAALPNEMAGQGSSNLEIAALVLAIIKEKNER